MQSLELLVTQQSPADAKVALFRSLFRGRDDVYPRRFESRKTGKSGYAPACANEWVRGICEKPRIKCANAEPWKAPPSRRRVVPAEAGDLPDSLELVLGNEIYIAKDGLSPWLRNELIRLAAFQNPEFYRAQAMRLPTYNKPRVISGAEDHSAHIGLPRGCLDDIREFLKALACRPRECKCPLRVR